MNIGRILDRFDKHYKIAKQSVRSSPQETRQFLAQYQSVRLSLPITDKSMKRICEVLTKAGYETQESCEGHKEESPVIFLKCLSQYHLRHLTEILTGESKETNFTWDLKAYTGEVFCNSEGSLSYILEPSLSKEKVSIFPDGSIRRTKKYIRNKNK